MENFDISRFLKVLTNSKLYVAVVLLLFVVAGYFYSFYYVTPMYSSCATVMLVQNEQLDANDDAITQSDITLNQSLLSTYTKIAKSDKVLEQVIKNLNLDISIEALANNISIQSVKNTEVFKVSVNNKDPFLAASITNELVNVFSSEIKSLYNMNNVYLMDEAEVNQTPFNINHIRDITMFGIAGFVVSFGLVVVIYLLDTTIKSEQDIEEYANISVLSTIPIYQSKNEKQFSELIVNEQPKAPISECFKTFRTNVMFSIQNKALNTILITSGFMGEGKSFVSSNLAVTFAQSNKKVILIDSDMRKGRLHKIFNISNNKGLSNLLSDIGNNTGSVNINEYIQKSGIANLHIMTSGTVPPNPSELLSSPNMKKLLEALNTQYDVVICDGTPCMLVSDSIILSKIVDTTIIVTANKVTKLDTLQKIKKSIEIVGGNIGGAIINKMNISSKSYENKYYYGNSNETNFDMDLSNNDCDTILENPLYISDVVIEDVNTNNVLEEDINNSNNDFSDLSSIISENTKEIFKLKDLYTSTIQNAIDAISKRDNSDKITSDKITEELNNLKTIYEDNINAQNSKIESLNNVISKISISDVMVELDNIKSTYVDNIKLQNDKFAKLNQEIASMDFSKYSDEIFTELDNAKLFYENTIKSQNEIIASLEDKISSLIERDNSEVILNELESIRNDYQSAIDSKDEHIASLEDKISSLIERDNSEVILNELENIRNDYQSAIDSKDEHIESLEDKVSSLIESDNSDIILNELESIKNDYQSAIASKDEHIASLEDKISSLIERDNSEVILNELESIRNDYQSAIESQKSQISNLDNKISNIQINDNSELLQEVANIYKQLENINSRFDYLEQQAIRQEELIKNFEKHNNVAEKPLREKSFEIQKLHDKVISIQDYLETQYNSIDVPKEKLTRVSSKKNKNVLDGQINFIDSLLENTEKRNVSNKSFVVDYDKAKNKRKHGLFSFKTKYVEPEPEYQEEDIDIVSQILVANSEENVG